MFETRRAGGTRTERVESTLLAASTVFAFGIVVATIGLVLGLQWQDFAALTAVGWGACYGAWKVLRERRTGSALGRAMGAILLLCAAFVAVANVWIWLA